MTNAGFSNEEGERLETALKAISKKWLASKTVLFV